MNLHPPAVETGRNAGGTPVAPPHKDQIAIAYRGWGAVKLSEYAAWCFRVYGRVHVLRRESSAWLTPTARGHRF